MDSEDEFYEKKTVKKIVCTPWAALVAFASVVTANILGCDYISVGNEKSANFGNGISHFGLEINHQYDKSYEFEELCNLYIIKHINSNLHYFSALQDMWEVDIMKIFTKFPKYLPYFISCNEIKQGSRWCANCAKCAFVFVLVSAFVPPKFAWSIFGDNLFEMECMERHLKSILGGLNNVNYEEWCSDAGRRKEKPFECVGTPEEALLGMALTKEQYVLSGTKLPKFFRSYFVANQNGDILFPKIDVNRGYEITVENLFPTWYSKFRKQNTLEALKEESS